MISGGLFNLYEPQFLYVWNGDNPASWDSGQDKRDKLTSNTEYGVWQAVGHQWG